uniref:INCENP_ARK-bind domain-containing protein n=1 Tax=Parastrongyloides trichosuri TaxID=131310 RepID=A0A0N4ZU57_PARTI
MTLRRLKTNNSKQVSNNNLTNPFLKFISKDYFDPTVDVVAFPDVVPVGEKLEEINIYLEGIYDDNYLEDIENIFTKLSNQRNELKNFFKKYDNKIKIPQTPLRGKNVSRLNIMKSKIEERQKSLQQKSSFIRSRINITDHCSTVQPNNMTNTRRMESIDNNIINSNRNSRKRKSSSVPGISVEDQIKAFAQADLRRKFLLDEKVKKIKIDREEKVKKIKKNIQKQNILKIQNQHDISCQTDTVSLDYNCANLQNDNRKEDNIKIGENIDLKMNFRKRRSNDDVFVKPIVPAKNSRLTKYPNDHHIDSEKSTTHKTEDIKKHKRKSLLSEKEHYIVENITDCEVTDDENNPAGIVPKWAKFENLKESLIHQNRRFNNNLAVKKIFGNFCILKLTNMSNKI